MYSKILSNIYEEIKSIGLPDDVDIEIKGYNKYYYGSYNPNNKKVIVYILNEQGEVYPKEQYMGTIIHELIHHYQWYHIKDFVRVKGVMHNPQFHRLYNKYMKIWRFQNEHKFNKKVS